MRKLVVACLLMLIATVAHAENQGDGSLLHRGTYVQGWSPNGLYTTVTSPSNAAASTHDLSNYIMYGVYCTEESAKCQMRLGTSAATARSATYPQVTIPAATWHIFVKNIATPFVNISGAHQWMQQ